MKLSETWLREWVNPAAPVKEIADRLLMGGLELEIEPAVAEAATGVVVGRIVKAERHPQADRLQVCSVDVGAPEPLQIVCGAPNAKAGMKAPCALVGAVLPGGTKITQAQLRGVDSFGMLCSAKELALSDKSEGLLELDNDAKPGQPIEQYLQLNDTVLNLEITPNRGDCLSVMGLARDVSALFAVPMKRPSLPAAVVVGHQVFKVEIEDLNACPTYAGRVVSKLNPKARTPDWMRERLRRAGLRCISPIVDVTNYVMLELGQPLHAFDTTKLSGTVRVRRAKPGEKLTVLTGEALELTNELLITDDKGPLALAGVMGGLESGVTENTVSVFFESACFAPTAVAGTARRHKLNSDASYRFERGVDPGLQRVAIDRATNLLTQICGGEVHPVSQVGRSQPEAVSVRLRHARLNKLLGEVVPAKEIEGLLGRLGITTRHEIGDAWVAKIPSWRTDLRIEPDLIEEVARLYGYDKLPAKAYPAALAPSRPQETRRSLGRARESLIARGWQEVVTLSFAEPVLQKALNPDATAIPVDNPMSEQMAVMRTTIWSGLVPAWLYNRSRQQEHARLFESGLCFEKDRAGGILQPQRIGGLAAGPAFGEQWGKAKRRVDFHDVKADVEALLGSALTEYRFEPAQHPALHPGQCARITRGGRHAGWIGVLHPVAVKQLDLPEAPVVFELEWEILREQALPRVQPLSEFPSSRRDLAVVVAEAVTAQALVDCIRASGGKTLANAFVFDIYRGEGLGDACKSVALGLNFNDYSRTLTVEEIDASIAAITAALARELGATIRQ